MKRLFEPQHRASVAPQRLYEHHKRVFIVTGRLLEEHALHPSSAKCNLGRRAPAARKDTLVSKKSRLIENRIRSSEHVVTAAQAHRIQIADALAARATAVQGPNTLITKETSLAFVNFLVDDLKHFTSGLNQAELAVVAEKADDVGLRDSRDTAFVQLQSGTVRIRSMVFDALGQSGLETYGLAGETPRAVRDVVTHAHTVVQLMTSRPFQVTVDGVTFDSAAMATTLKAKADAVEKAYADMQREEQELANALGNRQTAVDAWVDVHQGVADALTGLFRLAGRTDLAERVRPTSRTLSGEETPPIEDPKPNDGATGTG
jgi:hypothetical protein